MITLNSGVACAAWNMPNFELCLYPLRLIAFITWMQKDALPLEIPWNEWATDDRLSPVLLNCSVLIPLTHKLLYSTKRASTTSRRHLNVPYGAYTMGYICVHAYLKTSNHASLTEHLLNFLEQLLRVHLCHPITHTSFWAEKTILINLSSWFSPVRWQPEFAWDLYMQINGRVAVSFWRDIEMSYLCMRRHARTHAYRILSSITDLSYTLLNSTPFCKVLAKSDSVTTLRNVKGFLI